MDCAAHAKKTKEIFQTLTAENLIPTLDGSQAYTEREKELLLEAGVPEEILDKIQSFSAKKATEETDKATYQAMEALLHNLNTMHSRAGAQTPFSSINYGMDTSTEGRMVMKNMLLVTEAGLGNGETAIFPIQIFRVKDGVNFNPGEPNYDLFKLSCRVSAKRLFPNFSFQDAPFNLQYYKEGHPETEIAYHGLSYPRYRQCERSRTGNHLRQREFKLHLHQPAPYRNSGKQKHRLVLLRAGQKD